MATYRINVDGDERTFKNSDLNTLNVSKIDIANYHILQDNQAYRVELLRADFLKKELTVLVNGTKYAMKIEDERDQMVQQMGLLSTASQKVKNISAPMPGLIIDILVKENQEISEGDPLIILSAMKMENIILAQGDGIVKVVSVEKGDTVEKGQLILEME